MSSRPGNANLGLGSGEFRLERLSEAQRNGAESSASSYGETPAGGARTCATRSAESEVSLRAEGPAPPTVRYRPQQSGEYRRPAAPAENSAPREARSAIESSGSSPSTVTAGGSHEVLEQRLLEARRWLSRLESGDRRRTMLEVAVFRRDSGLLSAILASLQDDL